MTQQKELEGGYVYEDAQGTNAHESLLPALDRLLQQHAPKGTRILDLGCGNGFVTNWMGKKGYEVVGIDASDQGIAHATKVYPGIEFHHGSVYDPLSEKLGTFPLVVSLEVVEHLYAPRLYMEQIRHLVQPGGTLIISTPYHSYIKNLALAVTGKMESHYTALWDHGHIKFWSRESLTTLLEEQGFRVMSFDRVGRIKPLAKSMIIVAQAPAA